VRRVIYGAIALQVELPPAASPIARNRRRDDRRDREDCVIVTEVCHYPDGGTSKQRILVAEAEKGWRVLNPVE
jgi:hypothetical protein